MDISTLVTNVGFPIALAIYLLNNDRKDKERIIKALESSVQVIERSNKLEEKLQELLERRK